ncbi:MAG: hypothetical protein QOF00_1922 [Pseudonocardiales bacterium]|jgi:hypothetical protein|nr:hypothetical protein [Pseudonocardiales bacterium]
MTIDDIEELIRKYISTGIAVVVILVAPGTDASELSLPSGSRVVTVEPGRAGSTSDGSPGDTGGGAGPDPSAAGTGGPGTGGGGGSPEGGSGGGGSPEGGSGGAPGPVAGAPGTSTDPGSASGREPGERSDPRGGNGGVPGRSDGSDSPSSGDSSTAGNATGSNDTADGQSRGPGSEGTTAAATLGWGTPNREDDFSSGTDQWGVYDGAGHGGQGRRSPSAVSLTDGIMTVTGDASGTTAGMAWNPGQRYGRWEGRVRAPVGDPSYNALLLLWPDAEDWPSGGEVDFMEISDPTRQETKMFLHYGADNSQLDGAVQADATQWHNWAVEWTAESITAYLDGEQWFRTTDTGTLPPGPMHLCIQLDWFPQGGTAKETTMQVDWVRQYSLDGTAAPSGTGQGSAGGDGGGQGSSPVRDLLRRMFGWG